MPRESYFNPQSNLNDSRRQKWVKILNLYQGRAGAGALRSNDPLIGNSKKEIAAKVLACLNNVKVKG